jgi:hypothetical protein
MEFRWAGFNRLREGTIRLQSLVFVKWKHTGEPQFFLNDSKTAVRRGHEVSYSIVLLSKGSAGCSCRERRDEHQTSSTETCSQKVPHLHNAVTRRGSEFYSGFMSVTLAHKTNNSETGCVSEMSRETFNGVSNVVVDFQEISITACPA